MNKRVFGLLLSAALVAAPVANVCAESLTGGDNWYVRFEGKDPLTSNFTSEDLAVEAGQMEPGDDITFSIQVQNQKNQDTTVDYYLKNDILKSFETSEAEGGVYTYKLYYTASDGTVKTFYENGAVGGDASEGLMEADSSLDEYFFLDELDYNEEGTLTLEIALDGETQGNAYQDTMAQLMLQFQVEVPEKGQDIVTTKTIKGADTTVYQSKTVKTGDSSHLVVLSVIAGVAGVLLLLIAIISLKRKQLEDED